MSTPKPLRRTERGKARNWSESDIDRLGEVQTDDVEDEIARFNRALPRWRGLLEADSDEDDETA